MTAIYDLFLQRIAEGRGVTVDRVAPAAEGRLFAGLMAKEHGLVDEIGGLDDALGMAAELAKLPKDAPVEVIGDAPGLLDLLDGDGDDEVAASQAAVRAAARETAAAMLPEWLGSVPEFGAFLGSASPLLAGERALAALPYVLLVR